jgi:hypothetical protein
MRVDETRIPEGDRVKIRCPHCSQISSIDAKSAGPATAQFQASDTDPAVPAEGSKTGTDTESPDRSYKKRAEDSDLPRDAFKDFRFPAEKTSNAGESRAKTGTGMSRTWKAIIWIAASLVIIGFFALLVNIVLPGPGNKTLSGGYPKQEQVSPEKFPESGDMNRSTPGR